MLTMTTLALTTAQLHALLLPFSLLCFMLFGMLAMRSMQLWNEPRLAFATSSTTPQDERTMSSYVLRICGMTLVESARVRQVVRNW